MGPKYEIVSFLVGKLLLKQISSELTKVRLDRFSRFKSKICYFPPEDGWTSSGFYVPSTIFKSFRDDG